MLLELLAASGSEAVHEYFTSCPTTTLTSFGLHVRKKKPNPVFQMIVFPSFGIMESSVIHTSLPDAILADFIQVPETCPARQRQWIFDRSSVAGSNNARPVLTVSTSGPCTNAILGRRSSTPRLTLPAVLVTMTISRRRNVTTRKAVPGRRRTRTGRLGSTVTRTVLPHVDFSLSSISRAVP